MIVDIGILAEELKSINVEHGNRRTSAKTGKAHRIMQKIIKCLPAEASA